MDDNEAYKEIVKALDDISRRLEASEKPAGVRRAEMPGARPESPPEGDAAGGLGGAPGGSGRANLRHPLSDRPRTGGNNFKNRPTMTVDRVIGDPVTVAIALLAAVGFGYRIAESMLFGP
ncbi:MAG: hypothetical protein RIC14_05750 [Filomicrobium sp.]